MAELQNVLERLLEEVPPQQAVDPVSMTPPTEESSLSASLDSSLWYQGGPFSVPPPVPDEIMDILAGPGHGSQAEQTRAFAVSLAYLAIRIVCSSLPKETQEALLRLPPCTVAEARSLLNVLQSQPRRRGRPRKHYRESQDIGGSLSDHLCASPGVGPLVGKSRGRPRKDDDSIAGTCPAKRRKANGKEL